MKAKDWLQTATARLSSASIATARLDSLVLLEDATRKDRAWLLAHPEHSLNEETRTSLDGLIARRVQHEPLAYIRGKSEFYGREFKVTPATLQPRPETETMISMLLSLQLPPSPVIVDIGTGSGAIAITSKLEIPAAQVHAVEINAEALEIAKKNAETMQAVMRFYQGNLLHPILAAQHSPNVILANLPYVPDSHTINPAAMREPAIAIFGGKDGLDLYRELFSDIIRLHQKPAFILTESLPFQHEELQLIAKTAGYSLSGSEDFIQLYAVG